MMATFIHSFCSRRVLCVDSKDVQTVKNLKEHLFDKEKLPQEAYFFVCNGVLVDDTESVKPGTVYHTHARLLGGKGGFGSMLRAIGAQIEKTTNHEACRDLSGRRMRDVNTEKELKEWLAKQSDREREREQKRQERVARRRAMPNHKFDDPLYDKQRSLLAENQEDALQKGLKRAFPVATATATCSDSGSDSGSHSNRERAGPSDRKKIKKTTEWLGVDVDMDDFSDSSNSGSDEAPAPCITGEVTGPISEKLESGQKTSDASSSSVGKPENTVSTSNEESFQSNMDTADSQLRTDVRSSGTKTDGSVEDTSNVKDNSEEKLTSEEMQVTTTDKDEPFDLDQYSSAAELEVNGLERLKTELTARGMKCGGTLQQRAERLFSVKGLTQEEIDPVLLAKPSKGKGKKK